MTEDEKKQVGMFRYGVIHDFVSKQLEHGEQARLLREKIEQKWEIPFTSRTSISRGTILGWIERYKDKGCKLEALYPEDRSDQGQPRTMDNDTCQGLILLRRELPQTTIPILIEEMHNRGLVSEGTTLNQSNVYRFLHSQGLMEKPRAAEKDRRKFEAELPNDLWQSDVMHGPRVDADGRQRKTYLIAIIDDHSRLIVHAEFYLSENLVSYLRLFETALLKRGLPRKLYVDNGPAFRSKHLEYISASLNIALIHAKPYQPQGKGKIERWFKTVRSGFLSTFKGNTLVQLNEALDEWVNETYHTRKHGATGQTPFSRFTSSMECIRKAPPNIKDHFRNRARRRVGKDRTITLKKNLYEAPVSLIGKQVELLYHEDDPENIEIRLNNESYGIARPVDLHYNCNVKRDENNPESVIISETDTDYKSGGLM